MVRCLLPSDGILPDPHLWAPQLKSPAFCLSLSFPETEASPLGRWGSFLPVPLPGLNPQESGHCWVGLRLPQSLRSADEETEAEEGAEWGRPGKPSSRLTRCLAGSSQERGRGLGPIIAPGRTWGRSFWPPGPERRSEVGGWRWEAGGGRPQLRWKERDSL